MDSISIWEVLVIWGIIVILLGICLTRLIVFEDDNTAKSIQDDTTVLKPKIDCIKDTVSSTDSLLKNAVNPVLQVVSDHTAKIDTIATSMARFEGLVESSKANILHPNEMLAQIIAIYVENEKLRKQLDKAQRDITQLSTENQQLKKHNEKLLTENQQWLQNSKITTHSRHTSSLNDIDPTLDQNHDDY